MNSGLAIVFVLCAIYGVFHGLKVIRETKEGKRPAAKKIRTPFCVFWIDN